MKGANEGEEGLLGGEPSRPVWFSDRPPRPGAGTISRAHGQTAVLAGATAGEPGWWWSWWIQCGREAQGAWWWWFPAVP